MNHLASFSVGASHIISSLIFLEKKRMLCATILHGALRVIIYSNIQGPVVQSVVSLTSSLRVISLTVLADSIHNILIFFAEKMSVAFAKATHIFSAKNFSIFAYHLMQTLTNR